MTTEILRALDVIRKRLDAATPRNWVVDKIPGCKNRSVICYRKGVWYEATEHEEDRQLIAHSRTDLDVLERALRIAMRCINENCDYPYAGMPKESRMEIAKLLKEVK